MRLPAPSGAARRAGAVLFAVVLLAARAAAALLPEPESAALRCRHAHCEYVGGSVKEHEYKVEGKNIIINHLYGSYINVICNGFSVLDSPALPHAGSGLEITSVTLSNCPLPAARSLASTLAALNVTLLSGNRDASGKPLGRLTLEEMSREPPLSARHFLGLEHLLVLRLSAYEAEHVSPEPGFLEPLSRLEVLNVQQVTLPPGELQSPPPALRSLRLFHAGVERLPEALHSLADLRELTVASESALNVTVVPPGLLDLDLQSPATTLRLDAAPALSSLKVTNWVEEEWAKPLTTRCGNLTSLLLISPAVRKLPDDWLAACSRLETLEIQYADNLTSLPPHLLRNLSALTLLSFSQCGLVALPARLLDHVPRLRDFYLTENINLSQLPRGMFAVAHDLRVLNLSSNDLDDTALVALAPLGQLTSLNLANNPNIGDLCDTNGLSPMSDSTQLTELILRGTSVRHICTDWRRDMTLLTMLDLRRTSISELWFEDFQFKRNVNESKVLLDGAPVTVVGMTRKHYQDAIRHSSTDASVQIDVRLPLECDCRMYWTRRALSAPGRPLRHVSGMQCAGAGPLKDMPPEDMLCADTEVDRECAAASPPAGCACGWRPDDDETRGRVLVRVRCEGRGLRHVPRLNTTADTGRRLYELVLSHNNITELHADTLRSDIKRVDLRYNSLRRMNTDTVSRLAQFNGTVQLAGNPLDCSCSAAPLLRVLHVRREAVSELDAGTCEDGSLLRTASQADCLPLTTWLAAGVAALCALAVAAVSFLASRERRFFLKAVLHRWGCLWYAAGTEEDDGRRYDAFVTFSHKDEPTVVELVARLEPPYRLCVHYRDWIPGHYITEQIVESVQESRRTIALVSRHFLNSGWALAEFRQAHAHAMLEAKPRLVVVLLEDPSTLQLDEQLRRYLATNTYVRWGDPWFWDKLALALPRPRPPDGAPAAAGPCGVQSPPVPAPVPCGVRSPPAPTPVPCGVRSPPAPVPVPCGVRSPPAPTPVPCGVRSPPAPTPVPCGGRSPPAPVPVPCGVQPPPAPTPVPCEVRSPPVPAPVPCGVRSPPAPAPVPCGVRSPPAPKAAPSPCPAHSMVAATPAPLASVAASPLTTPTVKRPPPNTKVTISTKASESSLVSANEPTFVSPHPAPTTTDKARTVDVSQSTQNVTITVRDETSAARDVTPPAARDVTPPARDVTPSAARDVTPPAARDVTPPARVVTPSAARDVTPPTRDVTPPARDVTPRSVPVARHPHHLTVTVAT